MYVKKGFDSYKRYWEDQASFMDQSPWHLKKILKLTISNDFNKNIEEAAMDHGYYYTKVLYKITLPIILLYEIWYFLLWNVSIE